MVGGVQAQDLPPKGREGSSRIGRALQRREREREREEKRAGREEGSRAPRAW